MQVLAQLACDDNCVPITVLCVTIHIIQCHSDLAKLQMVLQLRRDLETSTHER